jgi:hypothetical protein
MNRSPFCLSVALIACGGCASSTPVPSTAGGGDNPEWRQAFAVAKEGLSPTGHSSYFDLTPGAVRVFREGKTTLTVTVLDQTRVVDGVTTRVVEEREEENGVPKEVSRNYFAIDPASGDLYYFGEDVDIYKDGRVSSHEGAWESGVNGAKFGLGLPGMPRIGERYYQEIAPGIAMDRAEVVGIDETVQTPAGEFRHCLHVKETTPIEPDVGHKWYAPGAGLVQDGGAVLVSWEPRRP